MFVFVVLKSILLFSLLFSGYYISKKNIVGKFKYPYWIIASFAIIPYTIIEGLRYDTTADYLTTKAQFVNPFKIEFVSIEPLFLSFNKLLSLFHIPYPFYFMFYSFLLIGSGLIFIKSNREVAVYALPLFYLATIGQSDNLVRQYAGFSLIFIGIKYFLINDKKKYFLLFVSAFFTHYSTLFILPFLFWFKLKKNPFKNLYFILGLYLASILWVPSLEAIAPYLPQLKGLNLYVGYLETDRWLINDNIETSKTVFSWVFYLRFYLFPLLILIFGYKILDKYRHANLSLFYHLFFIGILFRAVSATAATEIIARILLYFYTFYFIVFAYIIYDILSNYKKQSWINKLVFYYLILDVAYLLLKTTTNFSVDYGTRFIWDI